MSKSNRRQQAKKDIHRGRNEGFMRATLEQSNRNLTRPGGNGYKRKPKYAGKWEDN